MLASTINKSNTTKPTNHAGHPIKPSSHQAIKPSRDVSTPAGPDASGPNSVSHQPPTNTKPRFHTTTTIQTAAAVVLRAGTDTARHSSTAPLSEHHQMP
jgi:hypothetical protein